ncbi:SDR family NAD(P)-dependent oxidoreductase [Candidatus Peregrinibacteria bacterium]|nr:SDR family NAD(P)-dependent oxidoreductase [Candidatus Peregrinibacteria bacterium]
MKILVTGGAGFIGTALVKRLLKDGHHVRVLDDYSRGVPERLKSIAKEIETIQGDVRDFAQVDAATKGIELVYHLAAVNGTENFYKQPDRVLEVAVKGTMHTMDAALKHGCRRYILASSSEVYQEPTHVPTKEDERIIVPDVKNPRFSYSGGKIIGELLALHYLAKRGVEAVVFRPHNIYGPDMGHEHVVPQFFERLAPLRAQKKTGVLPFEIQGDGTETRSFCFIDDAVTGIVLVAEKGKSGELYHIGTEEEVSIRDVALLMAKIMGLSIAIVPGKRVEGSTPRRCPDIGKMRALGYNPSVDLKEGIKRTCEEEWKKFQKAS